MKTHFNKILIIVVVIILNIIPDQVTKQIARNTLPDKGTIHVVGNIVILKYAENDGAFLSMGSKLPPKYKTLLLNLLPALFMAGFIIYVIRDEKLNKMEIIWISTIIGGGISNLVDRFIFDGFVTDFLNFGIGNLRTGILNVADMSITFGLIFLILTPSIQKYKKKKLEAVKIDKDETINENSENLQDE